jgi:transcriptional regulator with XRE-family HTH domain
MQDQEIRELAARRLKELRIAHGYTKAADFAAKVGVDAPRLSRMETGKQAISTLVLRRAAQVLGVAMDEFFREPRPALVRMRAGEANEAQTAQIVRWAHELRDDLDMVAEYRRGVVAK